MKETDHRARDTTQSDFWAHYGALCQQANKFDREMAQCNMRMSNSLSEIEAQLNQCCCNLEQAKTMANLGMQNIWMQVRNDELEKKINDLMLQNMQGKIYDSRSRKTVPVEPKKYTIYDLYDLTFPDDPIKKHFITVCNNIEERYQERKEVLDQIEAPEVEIYHVEPVQKQMDKPKISQEALQTWVEFEKYVFIAFAAVYMFYVFAGIMLAFPVSIENGTRFLVDVTKICSSLFLATSSVSLAVAVFASRRKENDGGDNND